MERVKVTGQISQDEWEDWSAEEQVKQVQTNRDTVHGRRAIMLSSAAPLDLWVLLCSSAYLECIEKYTFTPKVSSLCDF